MWHLQAKGILGYRKGKHMQQLQKTIREKKPCTDIEGRKTLTNSDRQQCRRETKSPTGKSIGNRTLSPRTEKKGRRTEASHKTIRKTEQGKCREKVKRLTNTKNKFSQLKGEAPPPQESRSQVAGLVKERGRATWANWKKQKGWRQQTQKWTWKAQYNKQEIANP